MDLTAYEGSIDPKDVLILILGVQNEIVGFTRFVKYLFLVSQTNIFPKNELIIDWKSHHYGPYWDGFDTFINSLAHDNFLDKQEQHTLSGNATTKFIITPKGRKYFQSLSQKYESKLDYLTSLIRENHKKPLPTLLKFVYEQYPEFTTNSRIKREVLDG